MSRSSQFFSAALTRIGVFFLLCSIVATHSAETLRTNISEIRSMPRETAALHNPVKIQGVVSFAEPNPTRNCVLHDGKNGIYINTISSRAVGFFNSSEGVPERLREGMRLEVTGVTGPGWYSPEILPTQIKLIGESDLPTPIEATLPQLMSGSYSCQQVTLQGVIQKVDINLNKKNRLDCTKILVGTEGGGHFIALAGNPEGFDAMGLVDAAARFTGSATGYWNRRAEQIGFGLRVTDRSQVQILSPPPADPFAIPLTEIAHLKSFSAESDNLHRKRIIGTVIWNNPGKFFYLQSGARGIRVNSRQNLPMAMGDVIEAVGFVETPRYFGELREAIFRKIGHSREGKPIPLDWQRAIRTEANPPNPNNNQLDFDGRLVKVICRLIRVESQSTNSTMLYLENQGHSFTATVESDSAAGLADQYRPDSLITVIGVCLINLNLEWGSKIYYPDGFNLLLRSPADIIMLRPASWWTTSRLIAAIGIIGSALIVILVWTHFLRRRVSLLATRLLEEQQAKRDVEVSFKATLKERTRLAADLHDTVMQDLTAVTYQLEIERAQKDPHPPGSTKVKDFIYEIINRCRDDLQRSLWALRTGILEGRTFAEALNELAHRTERGSRIKCLCHLHSDGTPVPEFVASHLLLITQEAINNALKHAHPQTITVTGKIGAKQIELSIADDGTGFDLAHSPGPRDGHFGLMGMKERLAALNGTLSIQSSPKAGTLIRISIPL